MLGRQPAGLQRLADDRAGHARAAARAPRARRQGRGRRPAAHRARPRRPTSTSSSGPAPTRLLLFALVHVLVAEGLVDPAGSTEPSPASTRSWRWRRTSRPSAGGRRDRDPGGDDPSAWRASWRAPSAPRSTAASAPARRSSGRWPRWLVDVLNALTGNLDRVGGAMFPRAAAGASQHAGGRAGAARASGPGAGQSRVRGAARGVRRAAGRRAGRGDRDAGRGPGPRADHASRATRCCRRPNGARLDRGPGGPRLHGLARHLPQRDHAPRRRHPAGALAAGALALRPRALPARRPQRGQLLAAGARRRSGGRAAGRVAHAAAPGRRRRRARGRTSTSTRWTDSSPQTVIRRAGRDPEEELAALEPRVGPERILDFMLRTGPYELTLGRPRGRPARDRPRPAAAPPARGAAHAVGARSSSRPSRSSPTCRGCAAALRRSPNGEVVLIGRRQLRSNNSWMHNLDLLVRGPARCTLHVHPDDAARLGLADGGRRARALGRRRGRRAGRGDRRDHARRGLDPPRLGPRRGGRRSSRSRARTRA